MVTLFVIGALIGSGACLIVDLAAQNKLLKENNNRLEEQNKKFLKQELENGNS